METSYKISGNVVTVIKTKKYKNKKVITVIVLNVVEFRKNMLNENEKTKLKKTKQIIKRKQSTKMKKNTKNMKIQRMMRIK